MISDAFLDQLDAAKPEDREAVYAAGPSALAAGDVAPLLQGTRPAAGWLMLRVLAGPPGQPLPDRGDALERIMTAKGDVLDAWTVVMQGAPIVGDFAKIPIVVNAAASAWRGGGSYLSAWMSLRAALAALADGEPDRAWAWLEIDRPEQPTPGWDLLRTLSGLRADPALVGSHWTRCAAWGLYAKHAFPAVPRLEWPETSVERSRPDYVAAVEKLGNAPLREAILAGLLERDRHVVAALDEHPSVREILDSVLRGDVRPPEVIAPEDLDLWMWAAHLRGQHAAARLAGLLLLTSGHQPDAGPILMVMMDARVVDAPMLAERAHATLRPIWRELASLTTSLPEATWRDLAAALTALHEDCVPASGRIHADRTAVRAAATAAGCPEVLAVLDFIGETEAKIALGAVGVPGLLAIVQDVRSRLPSIERIDPAVLLAAVDGASTVANPTWLAPHVAVVDPLDQLLIGLVLRRSIRLADPPIPDREKHLGEHAWVCAMALWDIRSYRLFPLREALLVEAAEQAPSRGSRVRARLALANTRNALSSGDEQRIAATSATLEQLVEEAWDLGDLHLAVDAVVLWVRTLTLGPLAEEGSGAEVLHRAQAALARAVGLAVTGELRGRLAWAEATLLRHGGPLGSATDHAAALPLLEEAARLTGSDTPEWIDIERDRAHSLIACGQHDQGVALLRHLVDHLAPGMAALEQGYLLGALGDALAVSGDPDGAAPFLQQAVRLVADDGPGGHISLRYAQILLNSGQIDSAADLVGRVHARVATLSRVDRLDLHLLRMDLAGHRGDVTALTEANLAAMGVVGGTAMEPLVRLRRAHLARAREEELSLAERYIGGGWSPSSEVDAAVARVLEADPEALAPGLRNRAITWAQRCGRTWTEARLLDAAGRGIEARAILERDVANAPNVGRRLAARLLLLAVIPKEDVGALRAAIEAIEVDAPDLNELGGPGLCDLGAACHIAAGGDPAWTRRGRAHVELALRNSLGQSWEAHAARTYVRLTREIVSAAVPRSTSELAVTAREAVRFVARVSPEGRRVVHELVALLLLAGPIIEGQCLTVAAELLEAMPEGGTPDTNLHVGLAARIASVRKVGAGNQARVAPFPRELKATASFDDGPVWIVRVVNGEPTAIDPGDAVRDLAKVAMACAIRPDRADALLSELLALAPRLKPKALDKVLSVVRVVAATGRQGAAGWHLTRGALVTIKPAEKDIVGRILEAMAGFSAPGTVSVPPPKKTKSKASVGAMASFDEGIRAMTQARAAGSRRDRERWQELAIEHMRAAVKGLTGTPDEREARISLGNALRLEPRRDCDGAIREYERAATLVSSDRESEARLQKVWADALAQRGRPEDVRSAWEHIQASLRLRRDGGYRTASLVSASKIAFAHPDWSPTERARVRARTLGEAASMNASEIEDFLPQALVALAAWAKAGVDAEERDALVRQLLRLFPASHDDIQRAAAGQTAFGLVLNEHEDAVEMMSILLVDLNFRVVIETVQLLLSPTERASNAADFRAEATVPRQSRAAFTNALAEGPSAHGNVVAIRRQLEKLGRGPATTAIGRTVARVHLLAALCRLGGERQAVVRSETERALTEISASGAKAALQSALLDCLATVWSPRDVHGDPVADYDLSAAICRKAIEVQGGEERAHRDVIGRLGRALRYCEGGDRQQNLRDALRLYHRSLALDRKAGWAPGIANDLDLLADLEAHAGEGDETARLQRAAELSREAIGIAVDEHSKALYSANLAWWLTKLGDRLDPAAALASLEEADALYARAFAGPLSEGERSNTARNRTVCHELLAVRRGDNDTGPKLWRGEVARLQAEGRPLDAATAEHNLAEALTRRGTEADLIEAVSLYRRALQFRTPGVNARFHWESNLGLGRALVRLVETVEDEPDPAWFEEAETAFSRAIETARVLGRGQELHWAGKELLLLCGYIENPGELMRVAEMAWSAVAEARPALLLHREYAVEAAMLAQNVAFLLANGLASDGVLAPIEGGFVLRGKRADRVLRWLLRSDAALTTLVDARLRAPIGASTADWIEWQQELAAGDDGAVVARVRAFRALDPSWLAEEPTIDTTLAWLKRERGSAAIGIWPGQTGSLSIVIDGDNGNLVVVGLGSPRLPEEQEVATALRRDDRAKLLEGLCAFTRKTITDRLVAWMGKSPSRILWCTHGALRLVPPGALFPRAQVAVAASIALRPSAPSRARSEEVSIVLCNPGSGGRTLGPEALSTVRRLLGVAGVRGRAVVSDGPRWGPDVLAGAVSAPASATQVLREIDHAGMVVLIAHGRAEGPENAWIECVGAGGVVERLDAAMLQREPNTVAGLSVILLSCETGRTGNIPGHVGGIAGALLSAGAREVVAPLWPVGLPGAERVALAALQARAKGLDLSSALIDVDGDQRPGPELGSRAPAPDAQRASTRWDILGFVTWVG